LIRVPNLAQLESLLG